MSPSWRNRLYIAISPERISLLKLGRGLKTRVLARHEETMAPSVKQSSWQSVLDRLGSILGEPEWQNAEVNIVLSNRFVRYAVISFGAQLQSYSAQEAYARHYLTQIYGAVAEQWQLRIQPGKAGAPGLVSAVERALLEGLRQVCAAHKVELRSVTPCLMPVVNYYRKTIQNDPAWLVISEPGYSLLALLSGGEFIAVNGVGHESINELPVLLDRENLTTGSFSEPCKSVYVFSSSGGKLSEIPAMGYELNKIDVAVLDGLPASDYGLYASAVSSALKKRLELNYQKPANPPRKTAGWGLLLVGLALLIEMSVSYGRLHGDRKVMSSEIQSSGIRMDISRNEAASLRFADKDFEEAREIVNRISTPWDSFFAGFESVKNANVAILSIEPDIQTGLLRIQGEAKDYASVLTLVAQLRRTKPFSGVFLLRHEVSRDDPQHPVNFTLSMRWMNPT